MSVPVTTFLLDVNVLIALVDPTHIHHNPAHQWFAQDGNRSWATCPITENGLLRVISHPRYPNSTNSPAAAAALLNKLCCLSGHIFWPDDLSIRDSRIASARLLSSAQVTDTYLLALAAANSGRLATFDRRLVVDAVAGGAQTLHVL